MACTEPKIELPELNDRRYYEWPDRAAVVPSFCREGSWTIFPNGVKCATKPGDPNTPLYFPDAQSAARALYALNVGPGAKAEAEPEGPRWKHGQEHAVFLGRDGELDLWFSKTIRKGQPGVFCVTRAGAVCPAPLALRPGEYAFPPLATARRLARERGLLPEPKPSLPDGYDAAKIPADMEWTGEVRPPKQGEWLLLCKESGGRAFQASYDWTDYGSPILRHKPLPPTPATLSYRDEWPPKAAGPEPTKENPMPETTPAPQGQPLSESELKTVVSLIGDLRKFKDARPAVAVLVSLVASHARCLQRRCEPVPAALAVCAAEPVKVHTLTPIPGAFARFASAAGVAVVTALATIAGLFGGVALAVKFHLIG